jgi:hypothetical protein
MPTKEQQQQIDLQMKNTLNMLAQFSKTFEIEVKELNARGAGANASSLAFGCFGTFGCFGCVTGCAGCAGTFGCAGAKAEELE